MDRQKIHDLRDKLNEKSVKLHVARMLGGDSPELEAEVQGLKQQLRELGECVDGQTGAESGGHNKECVTVDLCGLDDNEIDGMTEEEVKKKLKSIRDTALWWASQEDDDRCWLDDIKVLQSILPHGSVNFSMPDDLTFLESCIRFKRGRCPKNLKIHEW